MRDQIAIELFFNWLFSDKLNDFATFEFELTKDRDGLEVPGLYPVGVTYYNDEDCYIAVSREPRDVVYRSFPNSGLVVRPVGDDKDAFISVINKISGDIRELIGAGAFDKVIKDGQYALDLFAYGGSAGWATHIFQCSFIPMSIVRSVASEVANQIPNWRQRYRISSDSQGSGMPGGMGM